VVVSSFPRNIRNDRLSVTSSTSRTTGRMVTGTIFHVDEAYGLRRRSATRVGRRRATPRVGRPAHNKLAPGRKRCCYTETVVLPLWWRHSVACGIAMVPCFAVILLRSAVPPGIGTIIAMRYVIWWRGRIAGDGRAGRPGHHGISVRTPRWQAAQWLEVDPTRLSLKIGPYHRTDIVSRCRTSERC
jgi:hypothetical protein